MRYNIKILTLTFLVIILTTFNSFSQTNIENETFNKINITDKNGKKQWLWIIHNNYGYARCGGSYISDIGYYIDDYKIGEWKYYTKDGFIEKKEYYYNDTTYLQTKFYSNNQIKSTGVIEIKVTNDFDTIIVTDPLNGNQSEEIRRLLNYVHIENWKYYHKDGTEAKKEEFDENGELIEKK